MQVSGDGSHADDVKLAEVVVLPVGIRTVYEAAENTLDIFHLLFELFLQRIACEERGCLRGLGSWDGVLGEEEVETPR